MFRHGARVTVRSASFPARFAALVVCATAAGLACASSRDASSGAASAAYARPKASPFDLPLRALLAAPDPDVSRVAASLGVTAPEFVEGVRVYRVLVVLEVGTAVEAGVGSDSPVS